MFERILLAVDGSDESKAAIRTAIDLAGMSGGEVLVVHVHPKDVGFHVKDDVESRPEAEMLIEAACDIVMKAGIPVVGDLRSARVDKVAEEVLAAADAYSADCVVVGSRGAGPLSEMFMGSVANEIVHRARCPVLVAKLVAVAA